LSEEKAEYTIEDANREVEEYLKNFGPGEVVRLASMMKQRWTVTFDGLSIFALVTLGVLALKHPGAQGYVADVGRKACRTLAVEIARMVPSSIWDCWEAELERPRPGQGQL